MKTRLTRTLFTVLKRIADAGVGEITTSKFASNRVHPKIAHNLMKLGWATYGPGGRGNTNLIVLTEQGKMEAELAIARSEANAQ